MILYHGTASIFEKPDLSFSREDIDFGVGFYCTEDLEMAKIWASNKNRSIVNTYEFDLSDLKIYHFEANEEWLKFIQGNRLGEETKDYSSYDILIGPTADDKLFATLNRFIDGEYTAEEAVDVINIMGYNNQIVLRNDKAIDNIKFKERIFIPKMEKIDLKRKNSLRYSNRMRDEIKIVREILRKNGVKERER